MVDIPSTAAAPPAQQATPPVANVTPVETTVNNVPDKIQQLVRQIQVNALISQIPGDGTVTLNSAIGSLTLLLPTIADAKQQQLLQQLINLLQAQKPVTVVVQPGTPPTQAFLLLPQAPQAGGTAALSNMQVAANTAPANLPQPPPPVTPGAVFTAIILPPDIPLPGNAPAQAIPVAAPPVSGPPVPVATAALQADAAPVPASSFPIAAPPALNLAPEINAAGENAVSEAALLAAIRAEQIGAETLRQIPTPPAPGLSLAPRAASPLTDARTPLPNALQELQPAQPLPLPLQTAPAVTAPASQVPALAALLQPGNEITVQINAVYPPAAAPASLPAPGPNQILATVTGTAPGGQLILKAGGATLYVRQSADAPTGSTLMITVAQAKPSPPVTLPDMQGATPLQQLAAALTQIDPQLAQTVFENYIPQPTAALPGALLFFMSAFKQGNVRSWLGSDAVDALTRAGKFDLVSKLTNELNNAGQPAHDATVGQWRAYPLPLYANNQFQALNLYVHTQGEKHADKGAAGKAARHNVRFLIDVRMSRLGLLQLDGFVQPKKLDMIVRSERTLPEGLHEDLRNAYIRALGAVDYAGSLNFQVGKQHWLNVQKAAQPASVTT